MTLFVVTQQHVPRIVTSGGDDSRVKTETVRLCPCHIYIIYVFETVSCIYLLAHGAICEVDLYVDKANGPSACCI